MHLKRLNLSFHFYSYVRKQELEVIDDKVLTDLQSQIINYDFTLK